MSRILLEHTLKLYFKAKIAINWYTPWLNMSTAMGFFFKCFKLKGDSGEFHGLKPSKWGYNINILIWVGK